MRRRWRPGARYLAGVRMESMPDLDPHGGFGAESVADLRAAADRDG